jgi:hypothetical protein
VSTACDCRLPRPRGSAFSPVRLAARWSALSYFAAPGVANASHCGLAEAQRDRGEKRLSPSTALPPILGASTTSTAMDRGLLEPRECRKPGRRHGASPWRLRPMAQGDGFGRQACFAAHTRLPQGDVLSSTRGGEVQDPMRARVRRRKFRPIRLTSTRCRSVTAIAGLLSPGPSTAQLPCGSTTPDSTPAAALAGTARLIQ